MLCCGHTEGGVVHMISSRSIYPQAGSPEGTDSAVSAWFHKILRLKKSPAATGRKDGENSTPVSSLGGGLLFTMLENKLKFNTICPLSNEIQYRRYSPLHSPPQVTVRTLASQDHPSPLSRPRPPHPLPWSFVRHRKHAA